MIFFIYDKTFENIVLFYIVYKLIIKIYVYNVFYQHFWIRNQNDMGIIYEKIAKIVTFTHKNKWFCCCNSCDITYHWLNDSLYFIILINIHVKTLLNNIDFSFSSLE